MGRPRKRLTVGTKSNAQRHGMGFWDAVCRDVLADYPGLDVDFKLVDAMAALMVTKPAAIDTVVATNLHADILSDLASALTGSLGNGATANINPADDVPSMFEPIHGSARSEEHTSELQSLMRISYAVFCLKKKTQQSSQNMR